MPTLMNVNQAKSRFSSVLAELERTRIPVTITRYGHPVAKLVPIRRPRDVSPIPGLAGRVEFTGDWFADGEDEWEDA
jgi:prevent-host-death family protein